MDQLESTVALPAVELKRFRYSAEEEGYLADVSQQAYPVETSSPWCRDAEDARQRAQEAMYNAAMWLQMAHQIEQSQQP